MASNFSFLNKDHKYQGIAIACMEAEKAISVSNSTAALQTRRALEIAVKWTYQYDPDLTVPYQDHQITDHALCDQYRECERIAFTFSIFSAKYHLDVKY